MSCCPSVLKNGLSFSILLMICLFASALCYAERPDNPKLTKLPFSIYLAMENTPVIYGSQVLLVQNHRGSKPEEQEQCYIFIQDLITGMQVAKLGTGFNFVSAYVHGEEMNVFGTVNTNKEWTKDIYRFWSTDLKNWQQELVIAREDEKQHLFNTSVCRDDQGYLMAYEYHQPGPGWSFQFARSKDLHAWEKIEGIHFTDLQEKTFCACPCIRYCAPYYYVIYGALRNSPVGRQYQYALDSTLYVSFLARSKDLKTWELSPTKYPFLDPVAGEGINNTDSDLFEWDGNTYIYYATGNQADWASIRVAMYPGPMKELFEKHFPENVPMVQFDAVQSKYIYPPSSQ